MRPPPRAGPVVDGARARPPVRGLGGHRPRRDPCDDPRRGHGLGAGRRGRLGRHGPDVGRRSASRSRSDSRSAPTAGSPARAGARRDRRPRRRRRDRRELATATGTYVAADPARKQELRERYGFRRLERRRRQHLPRPSRPATPDTVDRAGDPTTAMRTGQPATSEVTARAVAFVAEHQPAAEALGADPGRLTNDPDAFATRSAPGCGAWPTPSTSTASSASPPASAPSTASAGR